MRILPSGLVSARENRPEPALDIEEADLAEVEQSFIEAGPHIHVAAKHVVGDMIDESQPGATGRISRRQARNPRRRWRAAGRNDRPDRYAAADALDGGDVQLHRPSGDIGRVGAERQPLVGRLASATRKAIDSAQGPWAATKSLAVAVGLRIDQKLISPWRYSVTFLERWRPPAQNPWARTARAIPQDSGCAYSTNSKPSVPIGLSALTVAAGASCGNGPMAD